MPYKAICQWCMRYDCEGFIKACSPADRGEISTVFPHFSSHSFRTLFAVSVTTYRGFYLQ